METFKFQYDNTLRKKEVGLDGNIKPFKFQYDNTLSYNCISYRWCKTKFKFQYDNTLRNSELYSSLEKLNLNSNMIIL